MPARREPVQDLSQVLRWLAVLWAIEFLDVALTFVWGPSIGIPRTHWLGGGVLDYQFGLRPLHWSAPWDQWQTWRGGVLGIPCAPFLHAGFAHLAANSLGILILLWASLKYSHRLTWIAVSWSALTSGLLTFLIGDPATCHVGASGVIFGLIGFLLGNGIFRRDFVSILLAILVILLYGGAWSGMVPGMAGTQVSWQMHLGGFLGGVWCSINLRETKA